MSKYGIGKIFTSKYGAAVIIENKGLGPQKVKIKWLDDYGFEQTVKNYNLSVGKVLNPYFPVVNGVGFIGSGEYSPTENKKEHSVWSSMLIRAYGTKYKSGKPSYEGVYVNKLWHNFQTFAEWCQTQKGFSEKGYHLDKDLLVQGNKEYGPGLCAFVPHYINTILTASDSIRGNLPLGVHQINNPDNPYAAQIKANKSTKYLGIYSTPLKAHSAWQIAKADRIEYVVSKYAEEKVFDTHIAEALIDRAWKLRLDALTGKETVLL